MRGQSPEEMRRRIHVVPPREQEKRPRAKPSKRAEPWYLRRIKYLENKLGAR